jgi:type II secretory pathway pseudopilin PulG
MAIAALALVGVLFLAVFPTQAYLGQRRHRDELAAQVAQQAATNEALRERAAVLDSDEEIERLARLHYQLVKPGEEAYVILPDGVPPTTTAPEAAPAPPADEPGWLGRLWDRITSVF